MIEEFKDLFDNLIFSLANNDPIESDEIFEEMKYLYKEIRKEYNEL